MKFIDELNKRNVFNEVKTYFLSGATIIPTIWLFLSVLGYSEPIVNLITKICIYVFISIIPSILVLAFFHGEITGKKWTKIEKIVIPINLLVSLVIILNVIADYRYSSKFDVVVVEDELGYESHQKVVKSKFHKKVLFLLLENESKNKMYDWLSYGISNSIHIDLIQDLFIDSKIVNLSDIKKMGYSLNDKISLSKAVTIANENNSMYFINGSFNVIDSIYYIDLSIYDSKSGNIVSEISSHNINFFPLIDELSIKIKKELDLPEKHIRESVDLPVSSQLTSSISALENYTMSLIYSERGRSIGYNTESTKNEDNIKALDYINKALILDSRFAWAHFTSGMLYRNLNQLDSLSYSLMRTLENIDRFPEHEAQRIKSIYYQLKKLPVKRIKTINYWAKRWPNSIQALEANAYYYSNNHLIDDAIIFNEKVLKIDSSNCNILKNLRDNYVRADDLDQGLYYARQYLKCTSYSVDGYIDIAELYYNQLKVDSSEFYYQKAELIDPLNYLPKLKLLELKQQHQQIDLENLNNDYYFLFDLAKSKNDTLDIFNSYVTNNLFNNNLDSIEILKDELNVELNIGQGYYDYIENIQQFYPSLLNLGFSEIVYEDIFKIENHFNLKFNSIDINFEQPSYSSNITITNDNLIVQIGIVLASFDLLTKTKLIDLIAFCENRSELYSTDITEGYIYLLKAKLSALNNDYKNAISILENNSNIIHIENISVTEYLFLLADLYYLDNDCIKSEEIFSKLLTLNPMNPKYLYHSALMHVQCYKYDLAKQKLQRAINILSNSNSNYGLYSEIELLLSEINSTYTL